MVYAITALHATGMGVVPILLTKTAMGFATTGQMPETNARTDKAIKTGMANAAGQGIVGKSKGVAGNPQQTPEQKTNKLESEVENHIFEH